MPQDDDPAAVKRRLERFMLRWNPEKLSKIDEILKVWQGRTKELFAALTAKYGPEPMSDGEVEEEMLGVLTGELLHEDSRIPPSMVDLPMTVDMKHACLLTGEPRACMYCSAQLRASTWLECNVCNNPSSSMCRWCATRHDPAHELTYMGILALVPGSLVRVAPAAKDHSAPDGANVSWVGVVDFVDFDTGLVGARRAADEAAPPPPPVEYIAFSRVTLLDSINPSAPQNASTGPASSSAPLVPTSNHDEVQLTLENLPPLTLTDELNRLDSIAMPPPTRPMPSLTTVAEMLEAYRVPIAILCLIGLVLILVLVPLSFQYVPVNRWGLQKDTKTNAVNLDTVYSNGQYFWGLGFTTVLFPSTLNTVSLVGTSNDLDVFTDSGQTVSIGVIFRYRLNRTLLGKLYTLFGTNYDQRVSAVAVAAMRNAVTNYSVPDYTTSRANISTTLFNALQTQLQASAFVTIQRQHFSLQYILLPDVVRQQKVNVFEKTQVQQTNAYAYQATLYRLATSQLVQAIQNNATLVTSEAGLKASRMVAQANARAFQAVETETGRQLAAMAAALGVSANVTKDLVMLNNLLDSTGAGNLTVTHGISSVLIH